MVIVQGCSVVDENHNPNAAPNPTMTPFGNLYPITYNPKNYNPNTLSNASITPSITYNLLTINYFPIHQIHFFRSAGQGGV